MIVYFRRDFVCGTGSISLGDIPIFGSVVDSTSI
jgi:hypothetical protein